MNKLLKIFTVFFALSLFLVFGTTQADAKTYLGQDGKTHPITDQLTDNDGNTFNSCIYSESASNCFVGACVKEVTNSDGTKSWFGTECSFNNNCHFVEDIGNTGTPASCPVLCTYQDPDKSCHQGTCSGSGCTANSFNTACSYVYGISSGTSVSCPAGGGTGNTSPTPKSSSSPKSCTSSSPCGRGGVCDNDNECTTGNCYSQTHTCIVGDGPTPISRDCTIEASPTTVNLGGEVTLSMEYKDSWNDSAKVYNRIDLYEYVDEPGSLGTKEAWEDGEFTGDNHIIMPNSDALGIFNLPCSGSINASEDNCPDGVSRQQFKHRGTLSHPPTVTTWTPKEVGETVIGAHMWKENAGASGEEESRNSNAYCTTPVIVVNNDYGPGGICTLASGRKNGCDCENNNQCSSNSCFEGTCVPGNGSPPPSSNLKLVKVELAEDPNFVTITRTLTTFTLDGSGNIVLPTYTFSNSSPGMKMLCARFHASDGSKVDKCREIELVGEDPKITNLSCARDSNSDVKFVITGTNFGSQQGSIKTIDPNNTLSLQGSWSSRSLIGILRNAPSSQRSFKVVVVRTDGKESPPASCDLQETQISLGADYFCPAIPDHREEGVKFTIYDGSSKEKLSEQTVNINEVGVIEGNTFKFEKNKQYIVSVETLVSLKRFASFTADTDPGRTIILDDRLPVGDIFPTPNGDGTINSADKALLNNQWGLTEDIVRSGDFNKDKRVNSFDWSCMVFNFGESDESGP